MAAGAFAMRCALPLTAAALVGAAVWGGRGGAGSAAERRALAGAGATADSTATRCRRPEFRSFDFWLGDWEVRSPKGQVLGRDRVRRIADGCGLLESWDGGDGSHGTSINTYDTDLGRWTQRWVGGGSTLWLVGGLDGAAMVLAGAAARTTVRGRVLDRITWTPLPDGRVRQVWEISPDAGATWRQAFVGLYRRSAASRGPGPQ